MIYTVTLNPSLDRTLHFEKLVLGQVNRASKVQVDLGGKGVNVSLALHNLGIPSIAMGLAGGTTGEMLVRGLNKLGLDTSFTFFEGETRSNITAVDLVTRQTTKLNEPGPQVTSEQLEQFANQLMERLQSGDLVMLCGSLPVGAPDDTYARLIQQAKSQGACCALDTSGAALRAGCQAQPEWVKPNLEEAANLTGLELHADWRKTIAKVLAYGVQYVLLSAGDEGLALADKTHAWRAIPPRVRVASTVGAGDAALASAMAAWQKGADLPEIARWAAAAGTAAVMHEGSTMPDEEQIRAVYADTRTSPIY